MSSVLIVCGAGMGTSLIMKTKLNQFVADNNLDVTLESCGLDEGKGSVRDYDIIVCSTHLAEELGAIPDDKTLIEVTNIMDVASYGEKIKEAVAAKH